MPGIRFHRRNVGTGVPLRLPYELGNSLSYRDGDLVALTTAVTTTPTLRLLATADATALYETAANDAVGVLGLISDYITTDANGAATSAPAPVALAGGVAVTNRVSSYAASLHPAVNGRSRASVIVFDDQTEVAGVLLETTTITEALIGTRVGLSMAVTSGVTAFKFSTAAATTIAWISGVNVTHPKFNVTGGGGEIFVKFDESYLQYFNDRTYAT